MQHSAAKLEDTGETVAVVRYMRDDTADPYAADPFTVKPEVADGPEERERESAQTDETRLERELDANQAERHAAAERLKANEMPDPE